MTDLSSTAVRVAFHLSPPEWDEFNRLRPLPGDAFAFWHRVAEDRRLDPRTVMLMGGIFTAMPKGHGQHWCYPLPLKCKRRPPL